MVSASLPAALAILLEKSLMERLLNDIDLGLNLY